MTPGARISATMEILDCYLRGGSEKKILLNWFRRNRFAGSKDRMAIRDFFFNCLRFKLSCQWPFELAGVSVSGRTIALGMLKLSGQCFDQIFDGRQYSPKKLSGLEINIIENFDKVLASAPTYVKLNFPQFLEKDLKDSFDIKFSENLTALSEQASLFIRINRLKSDYVSAIKSLRDDGIDVEQQANLNSTLRVTENKRLISKSKAYLSGKIEIQDINSQVVVDIINPKKNTKILDFCAGSGGKTLAIASLTQGKAEFFVHDKNASKLSKLKQRCRRAGVKFHRLDLKNISKTRGKFDLVVADVPCSGTGVWKRNPGSKWLLTPDKLGSLLSDQKEILKEAAQFVKIGGSFAYITCSVLKSENEEQIAWFLSVNKTFSYLRERRLSPMEGGDGFYVSILKRLL